MAVIPTQAIVVFTNIWCRLLTCRYPYHNPEIVYDNSNDVISFQYLRNSGNASGYSANDNYIQTQFPGFASQRFQYQEEFDFFNVDKAPKSNRVKIQNGVVEGYYMTTAGGRKIGAFQGIKYATAERWERSIPVKPWKGILQAKKVGPDCLQFHVKKYFRVFGEEACLFANVYTPVISGNKSLARLPTVFYIHGGAFLFGSGQDYGPAYLLNEDIVLVSFNYRLGVLGFMSTGDKVLPGNLGMKDQALALQWVKENVIHFGGDPDRITMWGLSAGAVSTHLHYMSPMTQNLFQQGISQSGAAFGSWTVYSPERARNFTNELARRFNCPTKESARLVKCMKKVNPVTMVGAQASLVKWMPFPPSIFGPVVEVGEGENAFLTDFPDNLYKQGKVAAKPWISSTTENEGLNGLVVFELMGRYGITKLYWKRLAKDILDLEYLNLKNLTKVVDKITNFYFGHKLTSEGSHFDFGNMITDRYFHFPIVKGIQAHREIAPTYSYYFTFSKGNYSLGQWSAHKPTEWAAGHGEDEFYFFNSTGFNPGFRRNDPEYQLSKIMLNFVTNYIYSGKPAYTPTKTETESSKIKDFQVLDDWEPIARKGKIRALQFDEEVKMIDFNLRRIKFWADLNLKDFQPYAPL